MDYDFSKIPEFKDSPESFDITADKVSGRIPVTRLEHWQELPDLLSSSFFNQDGVEPIFRGHRRYDWALMPTLARASQNEVISEELANEQLCRFKQAIRGRIKDHSLVEDNSNQENELWAVGQHHGLMTPLLDWTYSPYVALFFAFSKADVKEEKDNEYRSIYILNKTFIADDDLCAEIPVVEPKKDDHGRLVNQAGLFTFSPYESTIENTLANILADDDFPDHELQQASESEQAGILAKYICKVYIKNIDRESCVKHLRQMNVHHASLFPDLIGASEFCNVLITEKHRVNETAEQKLAVEEEPIVEPESLESNFDSLDFDMSSSEIDLEEQDIIAFSVAEDAASYELDSFELEGPQSEASELNLNFHTAIADTPDEAFIESILSFMAPEMSEPTRQRVTRLISDKLVDSLTVDWEKRDSVQAGARNAVRSILRKYGFPMKKRDTFINEIFIQLIDS
jgi:hypothetical protein